MDKEVFKKNYENNPIYNHQLKQIKNNKEENKYFGIFANKFSH